jgi:hypothetical protein
LDLIQFCRDLKKGFFNLKFFFIEIKMFQAETENDFEDWTEAMSVLIEKIEKKNRIQIRDVDIEGKLYLIGNYNSTNYK